MVVSKYIGETEKNLELLFARAEDKEWILFFDEADALFGKRTNVRDAHDKYANQEVSYLLQRIEDYNGLVILATNMKNNIDEAFVRRFNSILKFPFPNAEQRALIWQKSFPADAIFADRPGDQGPDKYDETCVPTMVRTKVNIPESIKKYELTGGSIVNVVHYACLKAVERLHPENDKSKKNGKQGECNGNGTGKKQKEELHPDQKLIIYLSDVQEGIRRELIKEGKPFSI
jgi:SpoVK/Ycf46/Vps4 family AAA+-type ATPase